MERKKAAKKAEGKKHHQEQVKGILEHEAKKMKKQGGNEQGVRDLFCSHMHTMIQDIKEAVDLAHHEKLPPPEEVPEDKFKVVLTSDEEEEEDKEDEEEWIVEDGEEGGEEDEEEEDEDKEDEKE
ncbi:hypothetical protein FQN50_009990 [Emmonsiellopsis sp. PD_5]|nr:hypothetical protein FQN50_009990 [Emmonsiellopsis sp. PD_5]